MVFHKEITPADGERGIKMTKRRLVLTKVVLEQENTAAALLIRVADGKWAPLEFLHSLHKRTVDMSLTIEPGETVFFKCRQEAYFGKQFLTNDIPNGGHVRLHLYGNIREVEAVEPKAKRARQGADDAQVF